MKTTKRELIILNSKINTEKICDFIRKNSIALGHYIIYEYERKYIKENLKDEFGLIKKCNCKTKRYIKNSINMEKTAKLHEFN